MTNNYIDSKKKKVHRTKFYLLPLFILIVNQSINTSAFSHKRVINQLSFQDDSSQLIVRGIVYIISIVFFFLNTKDNLKLLKERKVFLMLAIYCIASMSWSAFPIKVFINWGHLVGLMLVVMSARVYFLENTEKIFSTLSVFFFVCILLSFFFVIGVPTIGINQDGRWQGISGNANTLGALAICSVWASLSVIYTKTGNKVVFYLILLMSVVVMVGTGSKTSFIVTVFIFLSAYIFVSQSRASNIKRFFLLGLWCLVGGGLFLIILILMPELLGLDGVLNVLGRDATFSGRTKVWEHAWNLFLVKPIHGWGFDSTLSVVKYTGGRLGQFHNGYFDLLVRGGSLGMVFILLLIYSLINNLLKKIESDTHIRLLFLSLLLGILLHNVSEASLLKGTNLFWVLIVFAYFLFDKKKGIVIR